MNELRNFMPMASEVVCEGNNKEEIYLRGLDLKEYLTSENLVSLQNLDYDGIPTALFIDFLDKDLEDIESSIVRFGTKIVLPEPTIALEGIEEIRNSEYFLEDRDVFQFEEGDLIIVLYSDAFDLKLSDSGLGRFEDWVEKREELEEKFPNLRG